VPAARPSRAVSRSRVRMRRRAFSSCASTKLSYLALAVGLDGPATVAMTDLLNVGQNPPAGAAKPHAVGLPPLYFDAAAAQQDLPASGAGAEAAFARARGNGQPAFWRTRLRDVG